MGISFYPALGIASLCLWCGIFVVFGSGFSIHEWLAPRKKSVHFDDDTDEKEENSFPHYVARQSFLHGIGNILSKNVWWFLKKICDATM